MEDEKIRWQIAMELAKMKPDMSKHIYNAFIGVSSLLRPVQEAEREPEVKKLHEKSKKAKKKASKSEKKSKKASKAKTSKKTKK
ncbi:MAG: hypothetical protein IH825_03890 [Candidatus Marinimicrobia bacterium]|nr:hypothetical protein [Candidatus Neomarinimicrobiota bacterium]